MKCDVLAGIGLILFIFCGSALDSQGWAGWVAAGGTVLGLIMMWVGGRNMPYFVMRHGGRDHDTWRPIYKGETEDEAQKIYERERVKMRQGGVRVVKAGEDFTVIREDWAPRLRTRW